MGDTALFHEGTDMRFVLPEADHVLILAATNGFRGGNHKDRFENIRLSFGIVSVQKIHAFGKFHIKPFIIPKIA